MEYIFIILILALIVYFVLRKSQLQKIPVDLLPDTFIIFDLETTGLNADRDEIIEIAAIRYKKGTNKHDTIQALVKTSKAIPQEITDLTGITQTMINNEGEPLKEVLAEFAAFIGNRRLVTFNDEFDMAFLQAAAKKCEMEQFNNPVSCALKMARRAWPKRKSFKLDNLASDGQFKKDAAHRALEDARRTLIVYAAAVSELKALE